MSWTALLADRDQIDLIVTLGYLGAVGATVRAAWRAGVQPRDRSVWVIVAGLLVVLVINQQTDLHRLVIRMADRFVVDHELSVLGPEVAAVALMGVVVAAALLVAILWLLRRHQLPPGRLAGAGLVVLAVHALGRIAMFSHLLRGEWVVWNLPQVLKDAEVVGLAMVVAGALLWRSHRRTASGQVRGTGASGSPDPVRPGRRHIRHGAGPAVEAVEDDPVDAPPGLSPACPRPPGRHAGGETGQNQGGSPSRTWRSDRVSDRRPATGCASSQPARRRGSSRK